MNKTIGYQLLTYGLLLAGLSYFIHNLAPASALPTLITGLAGGALSVVWGVRSIRGASGKALSMLTLVPMNFVMLSETLRAWTSEGQPTKGNPLAAVLITLALVLSFGMVIRIAWAGVVFDTPTANTARVRDTESQTIGKPAKFDAGKRA